MCVYVRGCVGHRWLGNEEHSDQQLTYRGCEHNNSETHMHTHTPEHTLSPKNSHCWISSSPVETEISFTAETLASFGTHILIILAL